jgi:hypothetical protein
VRRKKRSFIGELPVGRAELRVFSAAALTLAAGINSITVILFSA